MILRPLQKPRLRAVAVQHDELFGTGLLAAAAQAAGFNVELAQGEMPADAEAADLLISLGGVQSARELHRHPRLREELRVLEHRLAQGKPVLGICLGAQLLSVAAGGQVFRNPKGPVMGVHPVVPTSEGRRDALFRSRGDRLEVVHWHEDAFDLPPRALRLASSRTCVNEAFRIGNAWGLQFHLEVDAALFQRWLTEPRALLVGAARAPAEIARFDVWRLRAVQQRNAAALEQLLRFIARAVVAPEPPPSGPMPA